MKFRAVGFIRQPAAESLDVPKSERRHCSESEVTVQ